jgi:nitrogenase-associated protein
MANLTFYTKLGCATSSKQVDLLRQSGHEVEVQDLLAHPWLPEELTSYFGDMPVMLWFNPNSPRVKSGEIDPTTYNSFDALSLMLEDHLLIRRPLMESGDQRMCGFDPAKVHIWVGLASSEEAISNSKTYQTCSQTSSNEETAKCP